MDKIHPSGVSSSSQSRKSCRRRDQISDAEENKKKKNICRTKTEFNSELPGNQTDYEISRAPLELTRSVVWGDTDSRMELASTLGIALQQRVIMIFLPLRRGEVRIKELLQVVPGQGLLGARLQLWPPH